MNPSASRAASPVGFRDESSRSAPAPAPCRQLTAAATPQLVRRRRHVVVTSIAGTARSTNSAPCSRRSRNRPISAWATG